MSCPKCGKEIDIAIDDPCDLTFENQQWWHSGCYVSYLKIRLAAVTAQRDRAWEACRAVRDDALFEALDVPADARVKAVVSEADAMKDVPHA